MDGQILIFCLTAVPRSTQPSALRGTVKWVSAYELSNNNKWRWYLRMVAGSSRSAHALTALVGCLV